MCTPSQVSADGTNADIRNEKGTLVYYENGKVNTQKHGFVGFDGLTVLVGNGKVLTEASGLVQDLEHESNWYYLAEGRVQTQYTGLAMYDGAWFYVIDGKLANDYTGTVVYDGNEFYVVNGMLQGTTGVGSGEPGTETPSEEETETMDTENTDKEDTGKEEVSELVASVVNQIIQPEMTEYEKVKGLFDYMLKEINYDNENEEAGTVPETSITVDGVLATKCGTYEGYAKTFQALCEYAGLDCEHISGEILRKEPHAWNQICVDGEWYNIDTCISRGYDYFLLSDEDMYETHVPANAKHSCTAPSAKIYEKPDAYEGDSYYVETQEDIDNAVEYAISNQLTSFWLQINKNNCEQDFYEIPETMVSSSCNKMHYSSNSFVWISTAHASSKINRIHANFNEFEKIVSYKYSQDDRFLGIKQGKLQCLNSEEELRSYIKELIEEKQQVEYYFSGAEACLTDLTVDIEALKEEFSLMGNTINIIVMQDTNIGTENAPHYPIRIIIE